MAVTMYGSRFEGYSTICICVATYTLFKVVLLVGVLPLSKNPCSWLVDRPVSSTTAESQE